MFSVLLTLLCELSIEFNPAHFRKYLLLWSRTAPPYQTAKTRYRQLYHAESEHQSPPCSSLKAKLACTASLWFHNTQLKTILFHPVYSPAHEGRFYSKFACLISENKGGTLMMVNHPLSRPFLKPDTCLGPNFVLTQQKIQPADEDWWKRMGYL